MRHYQSSTAPTARTSLLTIGKPRTDGGFDPGKGALPQSRRISRSANYLLGNATRYNPLVRAFPGLNENVSLGKAFTFTERLTRFPRGSIQSVEPRHFQRACRYRAELEQHLVRSGDRAGEYAARDATCP